MRASCFGFACLVGSLFANALPALADPSNSDFRIPVTGGREVNLGWRSSRPGLMDLFEEKNGADWIVYWDERMETPRYIAPRRRPAIVEGPLYNESLIAGAIAFVEANRDFFGVSSRDLLEPVVYELDRDRLVVFREGAGGIPVRGASLRVLVDRNGAVASVDSFLLREPETEPAQFLSELG